MADDIPWEAIHMLVDYLADDELEDFELKGKPDDHIWHSVEKVERWWLQHETDLELREVQRQTSELHRRVSLLNDEVPF